MLVGTETPDRNQCVESKQPLALHEYHRNTAEYHHQTTTTTTHFPSTCTQYPGGITVLKYQSARERSSKECQSLAEASEESESHSSETPPVPQTFSSACCMFRMKLQKLIPYIRNHVINRQKLDHDLDDLELQVVRYKPEGLDALCKNTKFSKKELQIMYRGFKQECPTGIVNEDTFKDIYAQFFPQGDSSTYAHYVFNTFDQDHNGTISFEEFVMGLSVLARGTLPEKLQWAFNLYDINGDGIITRDEMMDIVSSIYDMMGKFAEPMISEDTARDHVDKVFQKMDHNNDGVISVEEFMETCQKDEKITQNILMFDTVMCEG